MSFTAADVMRKANTILQDAGAIRWTPVELREWLNEGMRAIITVKPNAKSGTVILELDNGTLQSLPPEYTILSRIVCNVGAAPASARGRAVRSLWRREILDSQIPGWQDPTVLPYSANVDMVLQDAMSPREFYVVPGNNGSGRLEAVVGMYPAPIPLPPSGSLNLESYTTAVPMDDVYQGILVDLVLFRAFSKDSAAQDAAARAQAHLALAQGALQSFGTAEGSMSLANIYGMQMNPAGSTQ
ncbi:hypothetical protein Q0601_15075 [Paracoccus onubensis]|uniref:phage adaptor protein n=1 Tax=Paracoccus onubensis TaxID=1675788 RepID=UPI00272EFEE9|nr:DUF6682 family protein [Paracoccus onubensis]MDP0928507.1 hypothetical protein [Paracoccus onubensis]